MASTGSACHTGADEPSHVLIAIGASPAAMRGAVRFSLGHGTTAQEIERALELIGAAAARFRGTAMTPRPVAADPADARRATP